MFTISEHDCGVSHLDVVETNSFKHLTHLSLKFLLGNDVDVKKYLAGCLTSLKVRAHMFYCLVTVDGEDH
jgi:hypothetical protein